MLNLIVMETPSVSLWKPQLNSKIGATTSFIKARPAVAPEPAGETVARDLTNINFTAPAPPQEMASPTLVSPAETRTYTSPEGTNGPLLTLDENAWSSVGLAGGSSEKKAVANPGLTSFEAEAMGFGATSAAPAQPQGKPEAFVLQGVLHSVLRGSTHSAQELLASLGVKPNQATGEQYDPSLQGQAAESQRTDWEAGQVADLLSHGRKDWAAQLAGGQFRELAGQSVFAKLSGFENDDKTFRDTYRDKQWVVTQELDERRPHELDGKIVAFRIAGEDGEIQQRHGRLMARDNTTSIFRLQGSSEEFNANYLRELAFPPGNAREQAEAQRPVASSPSVREVGLPKVEAGKLPPGFSYDLTTVTPKVALGLLKQFDVPRDQKVGEDFDPSLTGTAKKEQYQAWQLGQVQELLENGRKDWADKLLAGGHSELAGQNVFQALQQRAEGSHIFQRTHQQQGWVTNQDDLNLSPDMMNGSQVAFRVADDKGQVQEFSGVLRKDRGSVGSALFKLDGVEGEFNTNSLLDLAMKPGSSYRERFGQEGWQVKDERFSPSPHDMQGQFVSFTVLGKDGKLEEHQGVVRGDGDAGSAMFRLEGQAGEFNNNFVKDLAVRGPVGRANARGTGYETARQALGGGRQETSFLGKLFGR